MSPRLVCARAPDSSGAAAGDGARSELVYGKPHAGSVFQASCTVGELFRLRPRLTSAPLILVVVTARTSRLSHAHALATPS